MKNKCFARPPKFKNRLLLMIIGVCLQGLGLSLLIEMNLGTDPCSCLTQGVTNYLPISFGTCQVLCHLINFIIVIKFDLSLIGFGTIGNMFCLGYISDFFRYLLSILLPGDFFDNELTVYLMLLPVLAVFCIGAATYMTAGLGTSPYDGVPFILSRHIKKISFKLIRMIWDILFMLAGLLLGGDVGIVTVAVAFFLGPVISWIQKKLAVFITESPVHNTPAGDAL